MIESWVGIPNLRILAHYAGVVLADREALRTRLAAAERAGEALREDAERLGALQSDRIVAVGLSYGAVWGEDPTWYANVAGRLYYGRTAREAIDKARAALTPAAPSPDKED